jgi:copper chaperone CopZ
MGILEKNVIPGNDGKTFGTDAKEDADLSKIKTSLMEIDGIIDVVLNTDIFPREFTVYTDKVVSIGDIEDQVKKVGFHAIATDSFLL